MSKNGAGKTAAEILGVPEEPKNSRDRLIRRAIDLFYLHGFNAVGLDRILAEVGVTKTTFYKHFQSKDDLMVQAVRTRDRWEAEAWGRALVARAGDDPRGQLLVLFDVLHEWFNADDFHGCIFINTAAEFPNPNDPVHQAAAEHKKQSRMNYRDLARAAGAADPEQFADLYTLLVEGTLILRQVHGRDDAAVVAKRLAQQLIEQHVPAPGTKPPVKKRTPAPAALSAASPVASAGTVGEG
ncbi:MAG TPA: TetR/AcrR family transcriptional regulator [Tepidisphaeraceae bacterium]|nr:TetR/AcrR family transcriptional regulator [Tepidisphaeraceae bacterium]